MARVDVSASSDLDPAAAWKLASDLRRFDEWMTIFGAVARHGSVDESTRAPVCRRASG